MSGFETVKRGAIAVLAMGLSGCWLQVGGGPANTRFNDLEDGLTAANVESLRQVWSTPDGTDQGHSEPIIEGDRVFTVRTVGDGNRTSVLAVEARRLSTGELIWEHPLISAPIGGEASATPVTHFDGALWVVDNQPQCISHLTRLDPDTGEVLSIDNVGKTTSSLVAQGDIVASVTRQGCGDNSPYQLVVRDRTTRRVLWITGLPEIDTIWGPAMAGGMIYFVGPLGRLNAFAAGGCGAGVCAPLWSRTSTIGTFAERPVVAPDGQVLVPLLVQGPGEGFRRAIVAYTSAGEPLWQTEIDPLASVNREGIAVGYGNLYVTRTHGGTGATDLAVYPVAGCGSPTCTPAWTVPLEPGHTNWPTIGGGVVYFGHYTSASDPVDVVAVAAEGCGASTCPTLLRLPAMADATRMALGGGRLVVVDQGRLRAFGPS